MNYIVGIDEVGRGPIAGPVVVVACAVMDSTDLLSFYPKKVLKDSKKLSKKVREEIVKNIEELVNNKKIIYGIGKVKAVDIDKMGIVPSINLAMKIALDKISESGINKKSKVFLDGALKAPADWVNQETIIKGDEKIAQISLASIIAKVYRDNYMKELAKEVTGYGFENHAGYGTKAHYEAIKNHGMTAYHRRSFLKKLL